MQRLLMSGVAAALAGALWAAAPASAVDLKLLSSWDKSNYPTWVVVERYIEIVHKDGGGKVKIALSGPEVVPPFEQLQPVSAGVFDMLYTHGVYHAGSKGIALAVDAIDIDPYRRRQSGVWDFVDGYYQKHNKLKLVGLPAQSFAGYHMYLKEPPDADGGIKGRKIRGTQSYHGVTRALGATPIVLPPAQIYTSLEKGVIDGAWWPAAGMLTMKHYEVAKYAMRPTIGTSNEPILINTERWNKLAKAEQEVLLDAGKRLEYEMPWFGNDILEKEEAELRKLGVKYVQYPPAKAAMLRKTWNDSLWELAKQCCADGADELKALASKAALTN